MKYFANACKHVRGISKIISNALQPYLTCNVLRSYRICSCSEYVGRNHILATKMGKCSLKEKIWIVGKKKYMHIYTKIDKVFINFVYGNKCTHFFCHINGGKVNFCCFKVSKHVDI